MDQEARRHRRAAGHHRTGYFAHWSPDRSRILFDLPDDADHEQIGVIGADGRGFSHLTRMPGNPQAQRKHDASQSPTTTAATLRVAATRAASNRHGAGGVPPGEGSAQ